MSGDMEMWKIKIKQFHEPIKFNSMTRKEYTCKWKAL